MGEQYRECHLIPKFRVELEGGGHAELTIADCERIINTLMHHKLVDFEVNFAESNVMRRGVEQWEMIHLDGTSESCWRYEDGESLTISLIVNDETCRGGLPREEFRNTHLPKASDN